ncbi:MAG: class I SAM-dependent methyltransferase [Christensenella sp.]|nr:class I SAM-dependent methyltransferase [Christensenella sp.]
MHYTLNDGRIISSENSALSSRQPNKIVIDYISKLPNDILTLDLGCGKLRHSMQLYKKSRAMSLVDSSFQLEKVQQIFDEHTSVMEYVRDNLDRAVCFDIKKLEWINQEYDFVLCSNVLSAIPERSARLELLRNIFKCLANEGEALITTQFRNTYFSTYDSNPNAEKYLDGWILKHGTINTFYGIIQPEQLITDCKESNLKVYSKKLKDGSVYLMVRKNEVETSIGR